MKTYKLHILYHGVNPSWRENYEKYLKKFWDERIKSFSGTELKLTTQDTDGTDQVRLKYFKNYSSGKEAWGTANGKEISRRFVQNASVHQVMFMYDATKSDLYKEMVGNKYLTSWSFWDELYNNTEYTEVKVEKSKTAPQRTSTHELMHALAKKCQRAGRSEVIDHMDVTVVKGKVVEYYLNNTPNAPDGNYDRTIKSIDAAKAWNALSLDTRNMYESQKIKGEKTVVLKKEGKWWEIATPPELYPYIQAKYQIPNNLPEITRAEVEANKGGIANVDIYFN